MYLNLHDMKIDHTECTAPLGCRISPALIYLFSIIESRLLAFSIHCRPQSHFTEINVYKYSRAAFHRVHGSSMVFELIKQFAFGWCELRQILKNPEPQCRRRAELNATLLTVCSDIDLTSGVN